jgi:hypothetical protein
MDKFDKNLVEISNYINLISREVNTINDENIEIKLKNVNSFIKQISRKKEEIKNTSSVEYYKYICDMIHKGVKQISSKFDSIIEVKKEEQRTISSELSKLGNKKKLINYQR